MLNGLSDALRKQVENGVEILKRGGALAYPTDTVYGLGASMSSLHGVEVVYQVKARPHHMAMPLLVASVPQLETMASRITPTAWRLIVGCLPGVLTLVLMASERVPEYLRTEKGTVALRIPRHPVPVALIEGLGFPIVGTSANLSGRPSAVTAEEVRSQLGDRVDMVIDGGRCPGTESTIVDVTGDVPVVLRAGALPASEIERICGKGLSGKEG